jgi:hypothetical protein
MASVSDTLASFNGILRDVAAFGIALAGTLLVVQIVFPASGVDIIGSVTNTVQTFTSGGLTGLITLLLFVTFMRR